MCLVTENFIIVLLNKCEKIEANVVVRERTVLPCIYY